MLSVERRVAALLVLDARPTWTGLVSLGFLAPGRHASGGLLCGRLRRGRRLAAHLDLRPAGNMQLGLQLGLQLSLQLGLPLGLQLSLQLIMKYLKN